jgi:hypothetical protein
MRKAFVSSPGRDTCNDPVALYLDLLAMISMRSFGGGEGLDLSASVTGAFA